MPKFEATKVKKGDTVVVLSGKSQGRQGKVIKVLAKKDRILVERVNMIKRHTKPTKNSQGGIVEKEASIHISNVALYCPACSKGVRVGYVIHGDGTKARACKHCGKEF